MLPGKVIVIPTAVCIPSSANCFSLNNFFNHNVVPLGLFTSTLQPYWTNDKATSSFGKALQTAHSLKDLIEAAERSTTEKEYEFESDQGGDSVDDMISNPLVTLRSCFCSSFGSEPDCTNWTEDFIGYNAIYVYAYRFYVV